ncbi:MAG: hypothetical protein JXR49_15250 [Acidobacteria bacterium]|nr:hypothetical protein [Acidobacteriota bacterium]
MRHFSLALLIFLHISTALFANSSQSQKAEDMKGLIIHGEGFAFTISEPEGWTVNINDAVSKGLNAYFIIDGYAYKNTPGLIYIRVLGKQGMTVDQHLEADMEEFSQKDIEVVFEEFIPSSIAYSFASKKYLIGDRYCDYLCYVDPGEEYKVPILMAINFISRVCGYRLSAGANSGKKSIIRILRPRRNGRVVEGGGLETRMVDSIAQDQFFWRLRRT